MMSRSRLVVHLIAAAIAVSSVPAPAQPGPADERLAASFVLALGRTPTSAETGAWAKEASRPVAELLALHRRNLDADPAAARAVAVKASWDALGRAPAEGEASGTATYVEAMKRHLARLAERPEEYEQVLRRAYRRVHKRDAYSIEVDYWKRQPVLSFALVAGCIDDWGRRNQPGLMATAGVASVSINSAFLVAVRLSPVVAAEARAAAGLPFAGGRASALARGRTIVAPGAAEVASVGGIHFAAAGSDRLTPPI